MYSTLHDHITHKSHIIKCTAVLLYVLTISELQMFLKRDTKKVVLGSMYGMTCTLMNAINIDDEIMFLRKSNLIGSLRQTRTMCSPSSVPISDNYKVRCIDGTQLASSEEKQYKLVIRELSIEDLSHWWCELSIRKSRSSSIRLAKPGNYYYLKKLFNFKFIFNDLYTFILLLNHNFIISFIFSYTFHTCNLFYIGGVFSTIIIQIILYV